MSDLCEAAANGPFVSSSYLLCSPVAKAHKKATFVYSSKRKQRMSEVTAALSWRAALVAGARRRFKKDSVEPSPKCWCNVAKLRVMKVKAQMVKPSTYYSRIPTDIPLYEIPGASFDQYLEDKTRVFEAICPDKLWSQQINEEEWRVEMLPLQFLFLNVSPVVDMRLRLKSNGIGYPPQVPPDISKVLDLEMTRWELEGLDGNLKSSQFCLSVKGYLYPDRRGPRSRLKGQLQMSIGFVLPHMLAVLPQHTRQDVVETVRLPPFYVCEDVSDRLEAIASAIRMQVSKRLVENMKDRVTRSLIADYNEFKRERPS